MKLGIEVKIPDGITMRDDDFITLFMQAWLCSPQRERLIALEIPFLFIGGWFLRWPTTNADPVLIVLDISKEFIGTAKVVIERFVYPVKSKSFVDIRLDKVRDKYHIMDVLEEACSFNREPIIYTVSAA